MARLRRTRVVRTVMRCPACMILISALATAGCVNAAGSYAPRAEPRIVNVCVLGHVHDVRCYDVLDNVQAAIDAAGGMTKLAARKRTLVIRTLRDGRKRRFRGHPETRLQDGDVILARALCDGY